MTSEDRRHLVPLAEGWDTWRHVVLRGAGFPAESVRALSDPELAAAADAAALDPSQLPAYHAEHAAAEDRLATALRKLVQWPLLREAIAWQNPKLVKLCLDKLTDEGFRNVRRRGHEGTVANYVQRYSTKNDTIGFFGPVCWTRWVDDGPALSVQPGNRLLRRRTVYFEAWAIDAVARTLSADPELRPWLTPRPPVGRRLDGATPAGARGVPVDLSAADAEVLAHVDGARTVREIAAELAASGRPELGDPAALLAALDSLAERGHVQLDMEALIEAWPERTLQARLEQVGDAGVRARALDTLRRLTDARDRVAAAAGDDVALEAALADLGACFEQITGMGGERRAGQTYAGRTLVYEDTVRDARVALGPALREELGRPMRLLLNSARWLVAEIGEQYDNVLQELYDRRAAQLGSATVPLTALTRAATPHLYWQRRRLAEPVRVVVTEFQRRWATILAIPPGATDVRLRSADLAAGVAEQFPPRALPWATAVYHSPDVMLAAESVEAVERGDCLLVLGELHVSSNTLESRALVEQHDDPPWLLAAAEADMGERRVYFLPAKELSNVSSRASPPTALPSPRYTYWAMGRPSIAPPAPVLPAADLVVNREDGRLVVRTSAGALVAPLLEVLGELLTSAAVNAFKPLPAGAHGPRVTIDRLVVARESWTFAADDLAWTRVNSEADRFLAGREWRRRQGLPERAFYLVPVEDKPTYVDFASLLYVNALAKAVRRTREDDPDGTVTLTEMLPDPDQLWLTDADGARYGGELRLVIVDRRAEGALASGRGAAPR